MNYLNEKIGTRYSSENKTTQKLINSRLKEGFKEEDFITVIDKKFKEWNNTEFSKYLRPQTLFGNKFETYLYQTGGNYNGYGKYDNKWSDREDKKFDIKLEIGGETEYTAEELARRDEML